MSGVKKKKANSNSDTQSKNERLTACQRVKAEEPSSRVWKKPHSDSAAVTCDSGASHKPPAPDV